MAAGLPVVATRLNALPESVGDGASGRPVPPGDAAALAAAIADIASAPGRMADMGRQGRRLAEERFDLRVNATRVLEVLNHAAAARRAPESDRVGVVS